MKVSDEIRKGVEQLRKGGVIIYPTDTVLGLGCDPTNEKAVKRVFEIKKRAESKAMIILIHEIGLLQNYVKVVPEIAWDIVELADQPLSVVYPDGKGVCNDILAEDGSLAIRLVQEGYCNQLLNQFGKGLVSTSVNISGGAPAVDYNQIDSEVLNAVDYVVNCPIGKTKDIKPSKLIKLGVNGEFNVLRG